LAPGGSIWPSYSSWWEFVWGAISRGVSARDLESDVQSESKWRRMTKQCIGIGCILQQLVWRSMCQWRSRGLRVYPSWYSKHPCLSEEGWIEGNNKGQIWSVGNFYRRQRRWSVEGSVNLAARLWQILLIGDLKHSDRRLDHQMGRWPIGWGAEHRAFTKL
jgi:hypothetical protein